MYRPFEVMVPTVEFPPPMLSTLQVTPFTEAVNCCVCVVVTTAACAGETVITALARDEVKIRMVQKAKRREVTPERLLILPPRRYSERENSDFSVAKCTLFWLWLD